MADPTSTGAIDGARRAAILMVLLGDETAGKLLRHMSEEEISAIAREVARLEAIDPEVERQILEEYIVDAIRPPEDHGGPDVAKRLLSRADIPDSAHGRLLGAEAEAASGLLGSMLDAPPKVLAEVLAAEHHQTVALILLHLPPAKAAETLRNLAEDVKAETVLRMATLRQVRGELLDEVASSIKEKLGEPGTEAEEAEGPSGLERTASVLQSLRRSEARELLEGLERNDPERAQELRDQVYTFDTLVLADDRGIQELLRQVETKMLALAIRDAPPELAQKFYGNLSERAAGMLKEEIEFLGTVRPEEELAARREILDRALKLEADEKLVFAEANPAG
jgi:flagellar motor switch protein FliG